MPYKDNSELPAGVKDNLPAEAQTVYRKAFNSAYEGTCKGQDECSAKVAWSAVKRGWKKEGDKWVKKSAVVEFSLYITKAYFDKQTGKNRWVATCSNTQKDAYDTHMTVELFRDFIRRIEENEKAPEQFRSQYWSGGLPYLSIAHYEDLGGWASAGETEILYIDGEYLKAKGVFLDTEVGRALFRTISEELENHPENPIRISIAFLDYGHKHGQIEWERKSLEDVCPMCHEGIGDIYFTKGLLVHLASTRVPANEDTGIGLEERSMGNVITREDDAESQVGPELAKKLEKESILVGKSLAEKSAPALVIRAEGENSASATTPAVEPPVVLESNPVEQKSMGETPMSDVPAGSTVGVAESIDYPLGGAVSLAGAQEYLAASHQTALAASLWTYVEDCLYNILERPDVEDKKSAVAKLMAEFSAECKKMDVKKESIVSDPVDESLSEFRSRMIEIRDSPQIVTPEDKLRALQEHFVAFGEVVKKLFTQPEDKKVEEPPEIQQYLEPLKQENAELRSQLETLKNAVAALQIAPVVPATRTVTPVSTVPPRRSYVAAPVQAGPKKPEKKLLSVHQIVRRNMGLPIDG